LLGRVLESETLESLSVSGGFLALTAGVELLLTMFVLASGAGSWLHLALLLSIVGLTFILGLRYFHSQLNWTLQRLDMTNDLVERMIGHRTRLVQQAAGGWNGGEDLALERYLTISQSLDHAASLSAFVPRVWLLAGLLGLAPTFITGGSSTASLAVGVGGVLLAYQALRHLVDGGQRFTGVVIAWRRIRFLLEAAERHEPVGRPQATLVTQNPERPILTARDITYRYQGRGQPVLQGADISIFSGDRLLLGGASGGGKSTFASLLAGSRIADSGLLLMHGLDRETLGSDNWRRRVVVSPQFHENHVLMGPMSFNLLMGRRWPPTKEDVDEAERTCRDLGLGPLIDRMPAGISQLVGESGWQLSHGEKSRLYLARALLQNAELTILDETFAALDPQNLQLTLTYVLQHTPTLLVIAHP
jgi:ATP-binding cassette, subfamily B, bacterial